ncbi:hypothetical protein E4U23_003666 [Claviceps purpurea]|nr:hypothetical protein E4U23_003666 [Claviceps purpurea]
MLAIVCHIRFPDQLRAGEMVAVFLNVAKNVEVLEKLHASYGKNKDDLVKAKDTLAKCKHYEFS